MNREKKIRLGTRGSALALTQARMVCDRLKANAPEIDIDIRIIKTSGDKITDRPLREMGGKALFTKELEQGLFRGEIDLAVHSMKDVEVPLPRGLIIPCFLEREDPRDVLISRTGKKLRELPEGARVGTCSPRRMAQILSLRPDLTIVSLRGNVDTRLRKLAAGDYDAMVLAYAGLKRLRRTGIITEVLDTDIMIPAVAQGVIGIEVREEDEALQKMLKTFSHRETEKTVHIEHQFLRGFGGDCTTPIAGLAQINTKAEEEGRMSLAAMVALPDGGKILERSLEAHFEDLSLKAYALGQEFKAWYMTNMM
ncbi:MAG: hydroxymethylbilane synthase [Caedimonas sp.]|nr:hydroxymethylbilane synthase [Caedimonas sp.]